MRRIVHGVAVALSVLCCIPLAQADYQLIKSEIAQKQLSPMWRDVKVDEGQALYTDDDRAVLYRWSVPKSIGPNGAPFEMSAESRLLKDYIEAAMSVDTNFGATFKGDLNTPIKFKDENPAKPIKQSRSGQIIPPAKGDEFSVMVRMGATVGEDATVVYTYSNKAPANPPPTANVTVSADLKTQAMQLKKDDIVSGTLRVDVSGLPDNQGELEFTAFLTTYGLTDMIDDFGSNYMQYLMNKELGGAYTNDRVKNRTTDYFHDKASNGTNTYKMEEVVPLKIPAGIDEGQYLVIVFVRVKDTKVFATTRSGVDLANVPKRIVLTTPAKISPTEGFQGDNFYLELKYAVEGISEETDSRTINLRVRGNLTGPEQIGVPEKSLTVENLTQQVKGFYKGTGEVSLATQDISDPGDYVWHYTIYASEGFPPYEGEVFFKVKPGVANGGAPEGKVPDGNIRINGLGAAGELEIDDGSGWKKVKDGFVIPIGQLSNGIKVRTLYDEPSLNFPGGRKVSIKLGTEIIFKGDQGEAQLLKGQVNVFSPGKKEKNIKVTTLGGIEIEEVGTVYSVTYDPNAKLTIISVQEGEVLATPKDPKIRPVRVHAGDTVKIGDVVDITTKNPSDVTGIIDRVPPAIGAEVTGKPFEDRVRRIFNSPQIADAVAYDTFAAMSLIIVKRALPGSCYNNDPYVGYPTWDAHRKYAQEGGRQKSADNVIWKTGGTLACLSNQADKNALLAELNEVLRQAESGAVTRVADAASAASAAQNPAEASNVPGLWSWDWASSGEPVDYGATITYNADGTVISSYSGFTGVWKIDNGFVLVDWTSQPGANAKLWFTADPNVMEGRNEKNFPIRSKKRMSFFIEKNPAQTSNIPGIWKWDWNKAGEPVDQGASVTFNTDGTMTSTYSGSYGTWGIKDGKVNLVWTNTAETNTLYPTADSNVMEGLSQFGARIRATKKEGFTSQNSSYEYGIDRQGWDYSHFALAAPNPDLCASRCQADSQCRAWTYVKPGYQGPEPMCWLKNSVPPQAKGADFAVSGVVRP